MSIQKSKVSIRKGLDEVSELDLKALGNSCRVSHRRPSPGIIMIELPACGEDTRKEPGRCQMSSHDVISVGCVKGLESGVTWTSVCFSASSTPVLLGLDDK